MKTSPGKLQKQYYILIDESGTLPDPRDTYIVIAAVGLEDIKEGKHVVSKVLQSLRERKVRIAELKFYYAGEQTKRRMLSGIVSAGFQILRYCQKEYRSRENRELAGVKKETDKIKLPEPVQAPIQGICL